MELQTQLAKQLIDLQKVMFDGIGNSMVVFWEQTEKMFGAMAEQAPWVPPEQKAAFKEWVCQGKKGCEGFRNSANQGFSWLESWLNGRPKSKDE